MKRLGTSCASTSNLCLTSGVTLLYAFKMTFFTQEVMVFAEMAEWSLSSVRKSFCVEGFRERSETWMNLRSALIGQFNLALAPASLGSAVTCQCRAMSASALLAWNLALNAGSGLRLTQSQSPSTGSCSSALVSACNSDLLQGCRQQ